MGPSHHAVKPSKNSGHTHYIVFGNRPRYTSIEITCEEGSYVPYLDLRDYLDRLEQAGKLKRITKPVEADWEISAVGRVAFRDIPESTRPALLFENVDGSDIPVTLGILGGSRQIYGLALEVEPTPQAITTAWRKAGDSPIPPITVEEGPVKDTILKGDQADVTVCPVPTWTVGEDPGPYLTAPWVVTTDPETGARNVGTYRTQVKEPRKLGVWINFVQDGRKHVEMWEEREKPTPVAIVLGSEPTLGLCSVSRVPYGVEEYAMSGGPVSYTHLRAHETDSYLVCRLLLEKKKQKR